MFKALKSEYELISNEGELSRVYNLMNEALIHMPRREDLLVQNFMLYDMRLEQLGKSYNEYRVMIDDYPTNTDSYLTAEEVKTYFEFLYPGQQVRVEAK